MYGYQLTFFTQQGRSHGTLSIAQWLMREAKRIGIAGATLSAASEGFGRDGKLYSAHFFELAEQPVEITMAVSAKDAVELFERINAQNLKIFYVKSPIEFGVTGEE